MLAWNQLLDNNERLMKKKMNEYFIAVGVINYDRTTKEKKIQKEKERNR
jgi:hypothetical protein